MANNPSFSLYVNDFEGGTRHMTDEELGCYIRLLFAQFNREKLPNNPDFLRSFCTSFDKSWTIVSEKFEKIDGKEIAASAIIYSEEIDKKKDSLAFYETKEIKYNNKKIVCYFFKKINFWV